MPLAFARRTSPSSRLAAEILNFGRDLWLLARKGWQQHGNFLSRPIDVCTYIAGEASRTRITRPFCDSKSAGVSRGVSITPGWCDGRGKGGRISKKFHAIFFTASSSSVSVEMAPR